MSSSIPKKSGRGGDKKSVAARSTKEAAEAARKKNGSTMMDFMPETASERGYFTYPEVLAAKKTMNAINKKTSALNDSAAKNNEDLLNWNEKQEELIDANKHVPGSCEHAEVKFNLLDAKRKCEMHKKIL